MNSEYETSYTGWCSSHYSGGAISHYTSQAECAFRWLWEFPGGKCEGWESPEDCVRREVLEELDVEVTPPVYLMTHYYEYPQKTVDLTFFECSIFRGKPKAIDCADFCWVKPEQFCDYEFPPADAPVIQFLLNQSSQKK